MTYASNDYNNNVAGVIKFGLFNPLLSHEMYKEKVRTSKKGKK